MKNITPYPVLAHVVGIIKKTIIDLKIEYPSTGTARLKDGNASIHIEQLFDSSGNFARIFITDPREVIFSEDLFPALKDLQQGADDTLKIGLQTAIVVVNGLDIETHQVLETAKDAFDQLSNSYEFIKTTEKELIKVKGHFKFGNHSFEIIIMNEPDHIFITSEFSSNLDPAIKKTIESDTLKVQTALHAIFKKDRLLNHR